MGFLRSFEPEPEKSHTYKKRVYMKKYNECIPLENAITIAHHSLSPCSCDHPHTEAGREGGREAQKEDTAPGAA